MFYSKYNDNCHIVDNIENIPAKDLKTGDNVILLNGKNVIFTNNMIFEGATFDNKIFNFSLNSADISITQKAIKWGYLSAGSDNKYCMYFDEDKLIYLFNKKDRYQSCGYEINDLKHSLFKDYILKGNKETFFKVFSKPVKEEDENLTKQQIPIRTYAYLTIPLSDNYFMVLAKKHEWEEARRKTWSSDIVMLCQYIQTNINSKEDMVYAQYNFECKTEVFSTKLQEVFNKIKIKFNGDKNFVKFEETFVALEYGLRDYLNDLNKEENIIKYSKILSKIYKKDFDLKQYYSPIFVLSEPNVKAYLFDFDITITINDKLALYGDGGDDDFREEDIYLGDGKVYKKEVEDYIKNNKELQIYYRIAYEVANFEKEKKTGIDPRDGNYYSYGELESNDNIIYKDTQGIIVANRQYNEYYINEYGYFIETREQEKKNDIKERWEMSKKLAEKT